MGDDMKAHVGHKVAVIGTIEAASMKGRTMTPKEMAAMHSTLHITSVKMIAANCPQRSVMQAKGHQVGIAGTAPKGIGGSFGIPKNSRRVAQTSASV